MTYQSIGDPSLPVRSNAPGGRSVIDDPRNQLLRQIQIGGFRW